MKILAVIPARAGSKGIPNKNIRIINGKPLIYYSIKNALSSSLITDVVITTDSDAVRIIAEKMGAKVKIRDKRLCEDDVTLDAVIYDAITANENWDYIVTMQPTSPTLKVSTLDKALKFAIENDYDTVISAINKPHLSWGIVDGKPTPNYKERLNRQYLPPCFMETGRLLFQRQMLLKKIQGLGKK